MLISTYILVCAILLGLNYYNRYQVQMEISKDTPEVMPEENKSLAYEVLDEAGNPLINERVIVYDGLTYDEMVNKLNGSLSSTLSGTGNIFLDASIEYGVDPYLAVAIALHETGCKWTCSSLVTECYNVGGVKGSPSCGGGSYRAYPSLNEGIRQYVANIGLNYVAYGMTTAEAMQSKYAGSTSWALKVNNYIADIRNN